MNLNEGLAIKIAIKIKEEKDKNKTSLILIQGLPGSGKSTLANKIKKTCDIFFNIKLNHYEADDYFINPVTNEYNFNPNFLHQAHSLCKVLTYKSLYHNIPCIVSNTFLSDKELKPYYETVFPVDNISWTLIRMNTRFNSIHNIPKNTIKKMENKFKTSLSFVPDFIIDEL